MEDRPNDCCCEPTGGSATFSIYDPISGEYLYSTDPVELTVEEFAELMRRLSPTCD